MFGGLRNRWVETNWFLTATYKIPVSTGVLRIKIFVFLPMKPIYIADRRSVTRLGLSWFFRAQSASISVDASIVTVDHAEVAVHWLKWCVKGIIRYRRGKGDCDIEWCPTVVTRCKIYGNYIIFCIRVTPVVALVVDCHKHSWSTISKGMRVTHLISWYRASLVEPSSVSRVSNIHFSCVRCVEKAGQ